MAVIVRKVLGVLMGSFPKTNRTVTYLFENPLEPQQLNETVRSICVPEVVGDEEYGKLGIDLEHKSKNEWQICIPSKEGYKYTTIAIKHSGVNREIRWMGDVIHLNSDIAVVFNGSMDAVFVSETLPILHVKRHNSLVGVSPMNMPVLGPYDMMPNHLRYVASWPEKYDKFKVYNIPSYYHPPRAEMEYSVKAEFRRMKGEKVGTVEMVYRCRLDLSGSGMRSFVGIDLPYIDGCVWLFAGVSVKGGVVVLPVAGKPESAGVGWTAKVDTNVLSSLDNFVVHCQAYHGVLDGSEDLFPLKWTDSNKYERSQSVGRCCCAAIESIL